MKKRLLTVAFLMGAWSTYAQVGIGTTSPHKSAQLEILSEDKGILIPQVPLKNLTDKKTITNGVVNSLLVFNITDSDEIKPGYYYWFENSWKRIIDSKDLETLSDANTTNTSLTVLDGNLVLTDSEGHKVQIPLKDINIPTTLVNNGDGTYTYTSEAGTVTVINVPADVVNNFETIVQNDTVKNEIIKLIKNVGGNVYYDGSTFTYVDQSGATHVINLAEFVKANETVTTLVRGEDGTYTYTSEDGTKTVITVPSDVINNFEEILDNTNVKNLITNLIKNVGGNVSYDGTKFTYVDQSGATQVINVSEIVKANETVTTLVKGADGKYTYKSENGTETIIDIPAEVINNFENIVKEEVTVDGRTFTTVEEYITHLTEKTGGFTKIVYDQTTGDVIFQKYDETTNSWVNVDNSKFETIVKANETVTTLVKGAEGKYTYKSENGTETIIDIPAEVINNFENIVKEEVTVDGRTFTTVEEYITHLTEKTGGFTKIVYDQTTGDVIFQQYDETTNSWVNVDNSKFKTIVKGNETVTTLVKGAEGKYTYKSENGSETIIDIPAEVINNFENIVKEEVTVDGRTFTTVEEYITHLTEKTGGFTKIVYDQTTGDVIFQKYDETTNSWVNVDNSKFKTIVKGNETVTTLVKNTNGTYTYYNEAAIGADGQPLANATGVTIDPKEVAVSFNAATNTYEFKNAAGAVIGSIDMNATNIAFNNTVSGLNATNVQTAIEELLTKITNVANEKGNLSVAGGLEFTGTTDGTAKLLADAGIQIKDGGVTTAKIDENAVTSDKVKDGTIQPEDLRAPGATTESNQGGTANQVLVTDSTGAVTWANQADLPSNTVFADGTNTTYEGNGTAATPFKVNVATAKGKTATDAATLGVVKEAAENPTVMISQTGELSVKFENLNSIKEVTEDYVVIGSDVVILGNASGQEITLTLPAATPANKGKKLTIKKQDANEDHYVLVNGSIDGLTELYTALPYSGWDLVSDGAQWKIVNKF